MRRFLFGMAIASITVAAPMTALAGDREIADAIISNLKSKQADGSLKGFDIDLSVDAGKVTFTGKVANEQQLKSVLSAAQTTEGVTGVVNNIAVAAKSTPKPVALKEAVVNPENTLKSRLKGLVLPASSSEPVDDTDYRPAPMDTPSVGAESSVAPRDAAITEKIISKLSADKSSGTLRHFELDISTVDGEVWAKGYVANAQQKQHVLQSIQHTSGVRKVVDDITVTEASAVRPASGERVVGSSMPVAGGAQSAGPRAFAPSTLTSGQCNNCYEGGAVAGHGPMAMQNGPSYGGGVPRYDQPNMPNYAWPSYAAYPNYAAVTYPKQYSASAWPYIGPFYPYPQVPLGWRKVTLEWDDGMWYLDYSSK
ncbi:MAG: BON domain-containing protein [Pirellulales bacterium]